MKSSYINYTMQKEQQASSIAVLPRGNHQVDIVVLYEHVADSIVVNHWILGVRIDLKKKIKFPQMQSLNFTQKFPNLIVLIEKSMQASLWSKLNIYIITYFTVFLLRLASKNEKERLPLFQWTWWRSARPEQQRHRHGSRAKSTLALWCLTKRAPRRRRPLGLKIDSFGSDPAVTSPQRSNLFLAVLLNSMSYFYILKPYEMGKKVQANFSCFWWWWNSMNWRWNCFCPGGGKCRQIMGC